MDQTNFGTHQMGIEIAKDLELSGAARQTKGERFTLTLKVAMPYSHEELPLDIIVDRMSPNVDGQAGHKLANGDRIVETTARLEPSGEAFNISILFRLERMHDSGAEVFVSRDMERIILDQASKAVDQLLTQEPEG